MKSVFKAKKTRHRNSGQNIFFFLVELMQERLRRGERWITRREWDAAGDRAQQRHEYDERISNHMILTNWRRFLTIFSALEVIFLLDIKIINLITPQVGINFEHSIRTGRFRVLRCYFDPCDMGHVAQCALKMVGKLKFEIESWLFLTQILR